MQFVASTNVAAKSVLCSIRWVILKHLSQIALSKAFAWDYDVAARFSMAWVTEVSGPPTEPHRQWTAKFALKVDKLTAVLIALGHSCADGDCRARWTNKFFGFKFSLFLLFLFFTSFLFFIQEIRTFLHSSEIGSFAFEANIERAFKHRVVLEIVVVKVIHI